MSSYTVVENHDCKGSVKRYDYGTAFCDPVKGGCGASQGPDGKWRR